MQRPSEMYNTLICLTVFFEMKKATIVLILTGEVNDIHLWNNKDNHPEKYIIYKKNSCDVFCPNCVDSLPESTHILIFGEVIFGEMLLKSCKIHTKRLWWSLIFNQNTSWYPLTLLKRDSSKSVFL